MTVFNTDENRHVIPRWRPYELACQIEALDSATPRRFHERRVREDDFLQTKIVEWESNRTVGHASDLVGAGLALWRKEEVTEAAQFLLKKDVNSTLWTRQLAEHALGNPGDPPITEPLPLTELRLRGQISKLRILLRTEPYDPITWADLSHSYACLGLGRQAERSMTVAQQLARENRFVLRSASRLWIHRGDIERAHSIVLTTDRTRQDPWLVSAEIAIGSIADKRPRLVNEARRMLTSDQFSPRQVSELASAVATLELSAGRVRRARRLFERSLEKPTENSIAQAVWASRNHGLQLRGRYQDLPNTFEAASWTHYQEGEWKNAVEQCELWLYDQPFSSRPCILGSFLAGLVLDDDAKSEWFAKQGLVAHPSNLILLNNLAVALINLGNFTGADEALTRAERVQQSARDRVVLQATRGLFEYRAGSIERGRQLYLDAAAGAQRIPETANGKMLYALASVFHAIEEASITNADVQAVLSQASQVIAENSGPLWETFELKVKALEESLTKTRVSGHTGRHIDGLLHPPRTTQQ